MGTVYRYRFTCGLTGATGSPATHYIWSEDEPTDCPNDNINHVFNPDSVVIVDKIEEGTIKIKEENIPTGEHFAAATLKVNAIKNTISSTSISFPIPISALSIDFVTNSGHKGDLVSMAVGKDTITGYITTSLAPASAWSAQNYVQGNIVTYTHPIFGSRVYTCIADTVSNEIPTDTTYWQHGFEIPVSQTVIDNTSRGFYIKLYDGTNQDDMGRVIKVNTNGLKIYVPNNLVNSFSVATPTYVQQTVYVLKDCEIGEAWNNDIGQSKIGGSYVPADTFVTVEYDNKSLLNDKELVGRVEYLY